MSNARVPSQPSAYQHRLLRARDWQGRPEFDQLCDWWRSGGHGVCALVGIGGAGKTAIAERFLQVLPGGYPDHPKVPKQRDLPAPARLLVFSFYDVPNPDSFFAELGQWLQSSPHAPREELRLRHAERDDCSTLSYHQILELLPAAGSCLLVLDGFEKVQDDGLRGGAFGQINDGRLRDFVLRAADGYLPLVSLLITSRFRLWDLLAERTDLYEQIDVERLQRAAAVQLLRDRGVTRGTDGQLERIAREQGFHALSVDLTGGYIARFCDSDPAKWQEQETRFLEETGFLTDDTEAKLDPTVAAIREQERKFARLAQRYHEALSQNDPASLALLQRVCLFRLGVDAQTLAAIFTGEGKERVSGPHLARLSGEELGKKLRYLTEMRVLEQRGHEQDSVLSTHGSSPYTVHPAVRDGFLSGLDAEAARASHDATRQVLAVSLGGKPSGKLSIRDKATLDLVEELVHHTLEAEHAAEAWNIHWCRANELDVWQSFGSFERGARICREFLRFCRDTGMLVPGLSPACQAALIHTMGVCLRELGLVSEAKQYFERFVELGTCNHGLSGIYNLGYCLVLSGELREAHDLLTERLEVARQSDDPADEGSYNSFLASVAGLRGSLEDSIERFRWSLAHHYSVTKSEDTFHCQRLVGFADLLSRIGRLDEAQRLITRAIAQMESVADATSVAECNLVLADLARQGGDLGTARGLSDECYERALARESKDTLCWSALVRGRIELSAFRGIAQSPISDERPGEEEGQQYLERSNAALEEGLRIARGCGFDIYHIDLLLVQARVALHEGRADDALGDVTVALDEGVHPPPKSGLPSLLAATDPECGYAWGIAEGRHLRGEALLLKAAQMTGRTSYKPRSRKTSPEVREVVKQARSELRQATRLWKKLCDPERENANFVHPETGDEYNFRAAETFRVLDDLAKGGLTPYRLDAMEVDASETLDTAHQYEEGQNAMTELLSMDEVKGKVDFAIITIREDEFEAVLDRFNPRQSVDGGRQIYEYCRFTNRAGTEFGVAIVRSLGQGPNPASLLPAT